MPGEIKEVLRHLRKNQTPSENILWQLLRNRKLDGKKFVRQFPVMFEHQGRKRFFLWRIFIVMKPSWLLNWMEKFMKNRLHTMKIVLLLLTNSGLRYCESKMKN